MTGAPLDLAARLAASRAADQVNFNRALPRLGTVNLALSEWVEGHELLIPGDVPAGREGCSPMPQPRPAGTPGGAA